MEFDLLAEYLVRTYYNIYLAGGEIFEYLPRLLGRLGAVEILDLDGQVAQALREGAVVLQCEYGRGHEHRRLFAVDSRLERGAYGNFGLAEAHVAAYETIHRLLRLHVALYGLRGALLVGRILPYERRLQLLLQVAVGREGEALRCLALGI